MAAKTITVNLRNRLVKIHTTRRRAKASDYLREAIGMHENVAPEAVKLDIGVNKFIFKSVYKRFKPMKLNIDKTGDIVTVKMFQEKKEAPKEQAKAGAKPQAADATKAATPAAKKEAGAKKQEPAQQQKNKAIDSKGKEAGRKAPDPNTKQTQAPVSSN
jgi:ribosomal protein L31E